MPTSRTMSTGIIRPSQPRSHSRGRKAARGFGVISQCWMETELVKSGGCPDWQHAGSWQVVSCASLLVSDGAGDSSKARNTTFIILEGRIKPEEVEKAKELPKDVLNIEMEEGLMRVVLLTVSPRSNSSSSSRRRHSTWPTGLTHERNIMASHYKKPEDIHPVKSAITVECLL